MENILYIPPHCGGRCNCGHLHNGHIRLSEVTDNCYLTCNGCPFWDNQCIVDGLLEREALTWRGFVPLQYLVLNYEDKTLTAVFGEGKARGEAEVTLHEITPAALKNAVELIDDVVSKGHVEWIPYY